MWLPTTSARRMIAVVALLLLGAGCASERERVEETEQILAAAGFTGTRRHAEKASAARRPTAA